MSAPPLFFTLFKIPIMYKYLVFSGTHCEEMWADNIVEAIDNAHGPVDQITQVIKVPD